MNLVWHIAKKDLRRIAAPLGIWLLSFTMLGLWMRFAPVVEDLWPWDDLSWGVSMTGAITGVIAWVQMMTAGIFASLIMQEDPAEDTTVFWRTRPIGVGRLLAGKSSAILLGLVAAPVLALAPVWWASGFSPTELLGAAAECAGWQLLTAWIAVVVASLTKNLGQFLFAAIAVTVLVSLAMVEQWPLVGAAPERWTTAALVVGAVGGSAVLTAVWRQRRLRGGWIALAGAMVLLVGARLGLAENPRGEDSADTTLASVEFAEPAEVRARLGEAGMAALRERARAVRANGGKRVVVQPRIIGECALREGAGFNAGATTLRILAAIENGSRRRAATWFELRIEERGVWPSWREGSFFNEVRSLQGDDDYVAQVIATEHDVAVGRSFEDVLLVVLPKRGAAVVMKEDLRVAIARYSLLRSVAGPNCAFPLRDDQGSPFYSVLREHDARLVKVRLKKTYPAL